MNKKDVRFMQTAEEMEVTHVPQCNKCEHNIDLNSCTEFKEKPTSYMENERECPFKKVI